MADIAVSYGLAVRGMTDCETARFQALMDAANGISRSERLADLHGGAPEVAYQELLEQARQVLEDAAVRATKLGTRRAS